MRLEKEHPAGVELQLVALRAVGPADLNKRTATGLALDIKVVDLVRLGVAPEMKAGRFNGRLSVTGKAWKAKGQATIGDFEFIGYHAATFQGPTEVGMHGGDLDISADLQGAGGTGSGLFSAWMGATPHLAGIAARLLSLRPTRSIGRPAASPDCGRA